MMRFGPWLLVAMLLCCGRPPPPGPESGYRAFAEALRESGGDSQRVWDSLSKETRRLMEERAGAVAHASQGMIKDTPALMLVLSGVKPMPLGEVHVVRADEQTATLEVVTGAEKQSVQLVKEGDRWTVDLTRMFKK